MSSTTVSFQNILLRLLKVFIILRKMNGNLSNSLKKPKWKDIQGLRGLAIIYVLSFHLYPWLFRNGYLGVDIFFVISGYLMTMILEKQPSVCFSQTVVFYKKRIKRIFPAYFMLLFTLLLYGYFTLAEKDFELLQTDSKWAAFLATNIHKYILNKGYFSDVRL